MPCWPLVINADGLSGRPFLSGETIVNRKEIQNADDPVAEKAKLVEEYKELFANPYRAANLGYIDEVLKPEDTRIRVIRSFEMLEGKRPDVCTRCWDKEDAGLDSKRTIDSRKLNFTEEQYKNKQSELLEEL